MKPSKHLVLVSSLLLGLSLQAQAGSATWSGAGDGATWDSAANWTASPSTFPNATTDIATFGSAATITTLGQAITVGGLTLDGTGNVSITDNSNTLTFNGGITDGNGQNLTLNLNATFAAGETISAGTGSILTFGSNGTLTLGNFTQTLTGTGTIDINSGIIGGGTSTILKLTQGVTVNLAGAFSGASNTYNSTPIQVQSTSGTASTLNLESNLSKKVQLGLAGTNEKASLMITTSGVSDSGVVAVSGAGTSGATSNVFTIGANILGGGTATYNGGSFTINNTSNTNAATVILSANSGTTLNINTAISSAAGTTGTILRISGGGTVVFGAAAVNSYVTSSATNGTEVTASSGDTILELNDSGGVALTGNTTVDSGSTIELLASGQMTNGTLTLNGAGGATGTTGALENSSGNNTFSAAVALASASTISSDANTLTLTGGIAAGSNLLTISGAGNTTVSTTSITGTDGLAKTGAGTLTLAIANSYSGGTTISGGTVDATVAGALGNTGNALTINNGGVLDLEDVAQTVGAVTLGSVGTSTGSTIQSTGGAVTLTDSSVTVDGTDNTIGTEVTVGAVSQSASSGLTVNGTTGSDSMGSGASLSGSGTVGAVTMGGNDTVSSTSTLTTGGLTVNGTTGNTVSTGTVTGGATITNGGLLSVNGTLLNATSVTGANSVLNGTGTTGDVTAGSGGTVAGTLATGALTLNSGGTIAPGSGTATGTLSGTSLNWSSGGTLAFVLSGTSVSSSQLSLTGDLTKVGSGTFDVNLTSTSPLAAGTYELVSFGGTTNFNVSDFTQTGDLSFDPGLSGVFVLSGDQLDFDVTGTAIPEPGTWAMMLGGLATLAVWQRRKSRSS